MTRTPAPRADRQVGWLIAMCSLVFLGSRVPLFVTQASVFAHWWTALSSMIALVFVILAAVGWKLSDRVLRPCWIVLPLATIAVQFASYGAFAAEPAEVLPWVWSLEAAAVSMAFLAYRAPIAIALAVISAFSVAASALVFTGAVPEVVWNITPLHLSNIGMALIFYGIRNRLHGLHVVEDSARDAARRNALAEASVVRQRQLTRLVHDEVLSVLGAARLFAGEPPEVLRNEATHTIAVLDEALDSGVGPGASATPATLELLRGRLVRIAPSAMITLSDDGSALPAQVVTETGAAAAEALRNAVRHARANTIDVGISVDRGSLEVRVRDDGIGFAPGALTDRQLGIRESIQARMAGLGGSASIVSHDSSAGNDESCPSGTEVTLTWRP